MVCFGLWLLFHTVVAGAEWTFALCIIQMDLRQSPKFIMQILRVLVINIDMLAAGTNIPEKKEEF